MAEKKPAKMIAKLAMTAGITLMRMVAEMKGVTLIASMKFMKMTAGMSLMRMLAKIMMIILKTMGTIMMMVRFN
jgi:hypothetical protein